MKRERGTSDSMGPPHPVSDKGTALMPPWIPPNVLEQFIPYYLEQPMQHPQLYDPACNMDLLHFWMVFGRDGNHKGDTLHNELERRKIPNTLTKVRKGEEQDAMDHVEKIIKTATAFTVVILEYAEQLHKRGDPKVHEAILNLPKQLEGSQVVVIFCYGIPPNGLPNDVRDLFQAQLYWPCTDEAWRKLYFKRQFERYKALVEPSQVLRVRVDMDDDDYQFLVECSHFHTIDELDRFCNIVFSSVHRIGEVHHCDRRFMGQQESSAHDACTREIDGVLYRVLCRDRIRLHHLKSNAGIDSISAMDAKTIEDMFHSAGRRGYLAEPDNTHKTILYDEPEDEEAKELAEKVKLDTDDGTQRYVFDPETGKEVPVEKEQVGQSGMLKKQKTGHNGTSETTKEGEEEQDTGVY